MKTLELPLPSHPAVHHLPCPRLSEESSPQIQHQQNQQHQNQQPEQFLLQRGQQQRNRYSNVQKISLQHHTNPLLDHDHEHNNMHLFNQDYERSSAQQNESPSLLDIRVLGIPVTGAKSRVETQIKLCLQLVRNGAPPPLPGTTSTPFTDRITCYRRLLVPDILIANEKWKALGSKGPIKQGPDLYLGAEVVCASRPEAGRALVCHGCVARETKRFLRKKSGSLNLISHQNETVAVEDDFSESTIPLTNGNALENDIAMSERKMVLVNTPSTLDMSTGSIVLPIRIPCYSRHHKEKLGFIIRFWMQDELGRIVARGESPPVLITDNHKSANKNRHPANLIHSSSSGGTKRRRGSLDAGLTSSGKLKVDYPPRVESNECHSVPRFLNEFEVSIPLENAKKESIHVCERSPMYSQDEFNVPIAAESVFPASCFHPVISRPSSPCTCHPELPFMPNEDYCKPHKRLDSPVSDQSISIPYYKSIFPTIDPPSIISQFPRIDRVIPGEGPTHGGIEVTILGSGFNGSCAIKLLYTVLL
jgi:hypothetical protein